MFGFEVVNVVQGAWGDVYLAVFILCRVDDDARSKSRKPYSAACDRDAKLGLNLTSTFALVHSCMTGQKTLSHWVITQEEPNI